MNTTQIKKKFSWDDFKEDSNVLFKNEDFFIIEIEDPRDLPTLFQLDFFCLLRCKQGQVEMEINGKNYMLCREHLMILPINSSICKVSISPDAKGSVIGVSSKLLRNTFKYSTTMRNIGIYLHENPIIPLGKDTDQFEKNLQELGQIIGQFRNAPFAHEMIRSLFQFLLYAMVCSVSQYVEKTDNDMLSRGDILFSRFMELLAQKHTTQRQENFYAQELCVTPKYLSTVCKSVSGRSASAWINEYVTQEIRDLLIYSDLSVKEICAHMDFPNISFFGRYVKKHLGESPLTFRKNLKNK